MTSKRQTLARTIIGSEIAGFTLIMAMSWADEFLGLPQLISTLR